MRSPPRPPLIMLAFLVTLVSACVRDNVPTSPRSPNALAPRFYEVWDEIDFTDAGGTPFDYEAVVYEADTEEAMDAYVATLPSLNNYVCPDMFTDVGGTGVLSQLDRTTGTIAHFRLKSPGFYLKRGYETGQAPTSSTRPPRAWYDHSYVIYSFAPPDEYRFTGASDILFECHGRTTRRRGQLLEGSL